ncbi:ABC transporter permease [Candidatus Ishikawella capsulata]|uniref:Transport permease protein n=1 Tax=Candidatus Ishikawaella capsulata Mpkobe TaxID=476281 RepID=C5WCM0_9ENTR|nr:ABC transporter permease [Candidatus Ishikawaella capsulata]BAH83076.1 predicted transporter subunit [Candidatus Ishikawaella capsulata Mpkobe]
MMCWYWIALRSILYKEINRFMRIWIQTILPPIITIILYFFIFGNIMGRRIGDINGYSYMQFILPGLIMLCVITNSYSNVASSFFSSKFQRSIEELLVSPVSTNMIIIGYVGGGVLRGILIGALVSLVGLAISSYQIYNLSISIVTIVLTAILFSLAGLLNGILARNFDDISIIPTFVLTPMIYLGGIFYPIKSLSHFWQFVSKFNPIIYIINGFRWGYIGYKDIPLQVTILIISFSIIFLYMQSLILINKGKGLIS